MFHALLFALLGTLFVLFAFSAGRADQFVLAIPALVMAWWIGDLAFRSGRGALRRRRRRPDGSTDGTR